MLFYSIRIIVVIILILLLYLLFLKKRIKFYKYLLICILPTIILFNVFCFIPLEKPFIAFNSPEQAFAYSNINEINFVMEGKQSALTHYTNKFNKSEKGVKFFKKDDNSDQWDLVYYPSFFYDYDVKICSPYLVYLFTTRNTSETFIIIEVLDSSNNTTSINVSDNLNSQFDKYEYNNFGDISMYFATVINGIPKDYKIIIDDKVIYTLTK